MREKEMKSLDQFMTELEEAAVAAKAGWDSKRMHPNDQCEEVLLLIRVVREQQEALSRYADDNTWRLVREEKGWISGHHYIYFEMDNGPVHAKDCLVKVDAILNEGEK